MSALLRLPLLASLLLACTAVSANDIIGSARDEASGRLLYREHHQCNAQQTLCSVDYIDDQGAVFASKSVDYSESLSAPSLEFRDHRLAVHVRVGSTPEPDLVIDAGFDHFVRANWDDLQAAERIKFRFLPAGRDAALNMVAQRAVRTNCAATDLCLKIAIDSRLFGLFVPPILLTYDRPSRRLMRFRGLSNITDAQGDSLNVDIEYTYLTGSLDNRSIAETQNAATDQT